MGLPHHQSHGDCRGRRQLAIQEVAADTVKTLTAEKREVTETLSGLRRRFTPSLFLVSITPQRFESREVAAGKLGLAVSEAADILLVT